tara:strand:- start:1320 stop:1673 length:354 start_codon:yes stop_codon:yes gene_type:complete
MTITEQLIEMLNNKRGTQSSVFDFVRARMISGDYTIGESHNNGNPCRDVDTLIDRADLYTTHRVIKDIDDYSIGQTKVPSEVMKFINSPRRLLGKVIYGDHDDKFSRMYAEMTRGRR